MSYTERYCYDCAHWTWDENIQLANGTVIFPGHCSIYSCACATAIGNHETPTRYLSMEEVYEDSSV